MALHQAQASVPARWRFLYIAVLPFVFFAAVMFLSRPEPAVPAGEPAPADEQEFLNARIRLQTAAIAFSSGKLNPGIAIVTDRPWIYAPEQDLFQLPDNDVPILWTRMVDCGVELCTRNPVPREFLRLSGFPVLADPRDQTEWSVFLNENRSPGRFDLILLDCAFPRRVTSSGIAPWTSHTFEAMAQARAKAGTVFAVVLPQERPQAAACVVRAMKNVFGNVGTFCFGERVVAASSVPISAATPPGNLKDILRRPSPDDGETPPLLFSLNDISWRAGIAGYYAGGDVPDDAIAVVLQHDYSDSPPVGLMEEVDKVRGVPGRNIGALAYAEAEILPHLRKHLPGGFPYGKLCAWALGIVLLVYLILRYFIAWKPVHKQAFLAFEDTFLFTGCLALFGMALLDCLPSRHLVTFRWVLPAALPFVGFLYLLSLKWPSRLKRRTTRVVYLLLGCVSYVVAFRLELLPDPIFGWRQFLSGAFFLLPVGFLGDLVQSRIMEPVQPGPAIPLAFVLGTAASLAVFGVSLFFPAGPMVFAAVFCGFRLVFLDN